MARTDTRLAWIVLAILACAALLGFGHGLSQATSAPQRRVGDAGGIATPDGQPRLATPLPTLDEARVRQIAREEAEAAIVRARPKRPAAPKPRVDLNTTDDDAEPPPAPGSTAPPLGAPPG